MTLDGKVALVTGGFGGIGLANSPKHAAGGGQGVFTHVGAGGGPRGPVQGLPDPGGTTPPPRPPTWKS